MLVTDLLTLKVFFWKLHLIFSFIYYEVLDKFGNFLQKQQCYKFEMRALLTCLRLNYYAMYGHCLYLATKTYVDQAKNGCFYKIFMQL